MKKQLGFTLIELLVVIGIMALLSTLAVVSFGSARVKARDAKRMSDVRSVISAFAAAGQDNANNTLCESANTPLGANSKAINKLFISSVTGCDSAKDVTSSYINLVNVKDPVYNTPCESIPPMNEKCDYTVGGGGTLNTFKIGFMTEQDVQGLAPGTYHSANQSGLVN